MTMMKSKTVPPGTMVRRSACNQTTKPASFRRPHLINYGGKTPMIKTPCGKNALLILNVHHAHDARKFYKNFIRFSLDILNIVPYCKTWSTEVLA